MHYAVQPGSERELVAGLAFTVPVSPAELVKSVRADLLDRVDPNMIAFGVVAGDAAAADFNGLTLEPNASARARSYLSADPGGDLNLSEEEIAAFRRLGSAAAPSAVEAQVRSALLERLSAYRARGLAGIAPYARRGGESRSPGDELRLQPEPRRSSSSTHRGLTRCCSRIPRPGQRGPWRRSVGRTSTPKAFRPWRCRMSCSCPTATRG